VTAQLALHIAEGVVIAAIVILGVGAALALFAPPPPAPPPPQHDDSFLVVTGPLTDEAAAELRREWLRRHA
jgi:hypothetical protein